MDKFTFRKTLIISRQILLTFADIWTSGLIAFDPRGYNSIPIEAYKNFREKDRIRFSQELYRLKQAGFIKEYMVEKHRMIKLTKKGRVRLKKLITDEIDFKTNDKWDKKWRIVSFDIPNNKSAQRDILRHKLESIGFYQLQKSVYVFPFECLKEIRLLKSVYLLNPYVQYIVADRIETEVDLIKYFVDRNIISNSLR